MTRNASEAQQALERTRNKRVEDVAEALCDLLDAYGWGSAFGESAVNEARFYLANAEVQGATTQPPTPPELPLNKLLQQVRPEYMDADVDLVEPYAEWFVRFVLAALPDSMSRHRALGLALEKQLRRPNPPRQVGTPN